LFSSLGREIKTKQILTFAAMAVLALILVHRSVVLAIPFFLLGLIYLNYRDDVMPLTSYLLLLQQYRKLTKKEHKKIEKKSPSMKVAIHIPIEVQLVGVSVVSMTSGFYVIYTSLSSLNLFGIVFGSILTAIGIVILLALLTPFLNKIVSEGE
jgi:hypothetical protein